MSILVISCSLNSESRSRILAQRAQKELFQINIPTKFIDLKEKSLPICDGNSVYAQPDVIAISEQIKKADGILFSVPIYNYDANAAAKNLIELTGKGWEEKIVGFLCAAGGKGSYMSIMSLANSLMLDFRCIILPKFVYATGESFAGNVLVDLEIERRISELVEQMVRISSLTQND